MSAIVAEAPPIEQAVAQAIAELLLGDEHELAARAGAILRQGRPPSDDLEWSAPVEIHFTVRVLVPKA